MRSFAAALFRTVCQSCRGTGSSRPTLDEVRAGLCPRSSDASGIETCFGPRPRRSPRRQGGDNAADPPPCSGSHSLGSTSSGPIAIPVRKAVEIGQHHAVWRRAVGHQKAVKALPCIDLGRGGNRISQRLGAHGGLGRAHRHGMQRSRGQAACRRDPHHCHGSKSAIRLAAPAYRRARPADRRR